MRNLVEVLKPGGLSVEELRRLILGSFTVADYLTDPSTRPVMFNLLSAGQARLLAARLSIAAGAAPHDALTQSADTLSPGDLATVMAFFGAGRESGRPHAFGVDSTTAPAKYPLFQHQLDALRRTQALLYSGARRAILHMPTGAGKTRTAMNLVAEHLRSHTETVAVWLASSEELLEQAASEFEVAWQYLGNRNVEVTRYWGNRDQDVSALRDGLIVAGLAKLYSASKRLSNFLPSLADEVSLVVVDEAHQSVAETYAYVIDLLASKSPNTSLLGLTATPGRTYNDMEQDARLARFWGGKKVMLQIPGFDNPVKYLISEGYLARPVFRTVNAKPGFEPSQEDLANLRTGLDLPAGVLDRLAADELWNTKIVETTTELLSRHRRVIVFATSVKQAVTLAAVMRAMGSHTRAITGTTPKRERESILMQYTSNAETPMAVFNYGVLTTGFDAPGTSAAVIARPTQSLVLYSQMVGRALRGPRAGGNHEAEIVTVIDPSLPGFGDPAQAFTNWEDVW